MSKIMERSYYAILPANVRYSQKVCDGAKLLYAEITALSNEKGYCWATNKYFAALYGKSPDTISRWISELAKAEFILTIADSAAGNSRKIWLWESQGIGKNVDRVPAKIKTPYRQKSVEGIGKNAEQNNIVNNKKEKGEGKEKKQTPPPETFDEMMSEVERLSVEAKKEKAPQVAPPPLTIHSGFNEVFDTLYEKDENGEYQIRRDVEPKQPVEFDIEIHEPVKRERVIVPSPKRDGDVAPQRNANQITIKTGMNSAGETYIFEHTERVVIPTPPHISLDMRPNANTPTQLRIAMENFYRDWPLEWSDGILKFSKGSQYTEERQGEILGLWACHIIKMNQGTNTYQQLNADLQKWFRGQKDFDRNYNSAQKNGSKKQDTPNAFGGDQSKYQEVQKF